MPALCAARASPRRPGPVPLRRQPDRQAARAEPGGGPARPHDLQAGGERPDAGGDCQAHRPTQRADQAVALAAIWPAGRRRAMDGPAGAGRAAEPGLHPHEAPPAIGGPSDAKSRPGRGLRRPGSRASSARRALGLETESRGPIATPTVALAPQAATLWNDRAGNTKAALDLAQRAQQLGSQDANALATRLANANAEEGG